MAAAMKSGRFKGWRSRPLSMKGSSARKVIASTLHRQADEFIGEYFQGLVVGQKVPLGFDVGRGLEWIGRDKGFSGEKEIRDQKRPPQEKRQVKGDGGGVLQSIVGEERDAARMVLVTIVSLPATGCRYP